MDTLPAPCQPPQFNYRKICKRLPPPWSRKGLLRWIFSREAQGICLAVTLAPLDLQPRESRPQLGNSQELRFQFGPLIYLLWPGETFFMMSGSYSCKYLFFLYIISLVLARSSTDTNVGCGYGASLSFFMFANTYSRRGWIVQYPRLFFYAINTSLTYNGHCVS